MVFVVKPHSVIDVITNSSSELFISTKKGDTEAVKEVILTLMKEEGYTESEYSAFFDDPYVFTEERLKELTWDDYENKEFPSDWLYGYEKKANIGSIMIESASDNSVPYELMEAIEGKLGWPRYHLG